MDPVIVVGAGPVGLALSLALARHGVPSVVLDAGDGEVEPRAARTCVLRPDTAAQVAQVFALGGARWAAWRTERRRQPVRRVELDAATSPVHLQQYALERSLRAALEQESLARIVTGAWLDELEQDERGVAARTRGPDGTWWRGSYLVGCDGARSTVRKLLGIRFPGRTSVERHAVAALRVGLPWDGEALLHRELPGRGDEAVARPLPNGVWRLDWLLPPRGELVTPEELLDRIRGTLTAWCGEVPPYELLDTGVYTAHQRLARRWRAGRAFLAGDAARLLGALGTQPVDEGLRDAANLAWKLALCWHRRAPEELLDSYGAERRGAVGARLRALDQALPLVRGSGGLRTLLPGGSRGRLDLLTDGHLGHGPLGAPPCYEHSPLTPDEGTVPGAVAVGTTPGAPVADVAVTALDGTRERLWQRLGRGLLVLLVAPGTRVWDSRHWLSAGLMPQLAAVVERLPLAAELLVTESYPGATAHTVLVVRPDGHLAAALPGARTDELRACAEAVRGALARETGGDGKGNEGGEERGSGQDAAGSGAGRTGRSADRP
ncbi:FAD-dependent monooxygenase [Streptomyces sp. TRM 70361]|uniref:FAD-dependent monooxygenase n=1 Tax=Streptomyces sp. TRM 70361 TaxID=3116553 RepID=UPI002E7BBCC9|nr:FAD-dependent monooxygenase [Streptomyces sp. TRM 70361]MEE1940864.1 FAD-dependent monooxygenase [Streptomyces sp. TRM 70361]